MRARGLARVCLARDDDDNDDAIVAVHRLRVPNGNASIRTTLRSLVRSFVRSFVRLFVYASFPIRLPSHRSGFLLFRFRPIAHPTRRDATRRSCRTVAGSSCRSLLRGSVSCLAFAMQQSKRMTCSLMNEATSKNDGLQWSENHEESESKSPGYLSAARFRRWTGGAAAATAAAAAAAEEAI